jgi:MFS family permease
LVVGSPQSQAASYSSSAAILQVSSSTGLGLIVPGHLISGFGVGFISAIIILYMSEIPPRKVRGAIVSGYQFCVTIGESIIILWHEAGRHPG